MTTFTDGPAADVCLALRRVPLFLRVVRSRRGAWDALDQLTDMPAIQEQVHVYFKISEMPGAFLCAGRGRGGYFPAATYRLWDNQPPDDTARGIRSWQDWCRAEANRLGLKGRSGDEAGAPTLAHGASGGRADG